MIEKIAAFITGGIAFPVSMIVLSLLAGVVFFCNGDYPKGFYWLFAAGLTTTTIFM